MPYVGKKPADIIATAIDTTTGTFSGDIDASTVNATGDTAAGDNAAIGFTSAEGLILTGQGSTSDITVKNDADATVFTVPTGTDDILFPDNAKILLGAGSDLQIFHDGSNSNIDDAGTGPLRISSNGTGIDFNKGTSETMAKFKTDGAVELYHDGTKKFETTSSGVTVTGSLLTTNIYGASDGNTGIQWEGSDVLTFHTGGAENIQLTANAIVFNQDGANMDLRVEGDSVTNLFFIDASQEALALGVDNPTRHSKTTRLLCYNGSGTGTDFALHVGRVGTGAESQVCFSNGFGEVGSIKTNGTSTSFNTSSDYRLKENVVTEWDATSRLKQLKPSRFNFKTDADKTVDGFLAHEVSSVVPEAINGEKDATQDIGTIKDAEGNVELENVPQSRKKDGQTWTKTGTENLYQDIDQSKLVPLLTKTLQEQQATIEALTARIVTLENA